MRSNEGKELVTVGANLRVGDVVSDEHESRLKLVRPLQTGVLFGREFTKWHAENTAGAIITAAFYRRASYQVLNTFQPINPNK